MSNLRSLTVAVAVVASASAAVGQDKKSIDNPEYTSWSKFKPGSSFTVKTTSEAAAAKTELVMVYKLIDVQADKAIVETEVTTKINGMEFKAPGQKRDVPKTVEVPAAQAKGDAVKPPGTVEEGTETVKVGDAEYKCKWYKTKIEVMGMTTESKMWLSDELPVGVIVKGETKGPAGETKMELTAVSKK